MSRTSSFLISPILGLYSVWSSITPYLGTGDLIRLQSTGNRVLLDHLRTSASYLNLSWLLPRFIDLDLVLERASQFEHLTGVSLYCLIEHIDAMETIDMTHLPRHLTTLKMNFRDAPGILLGFDTPLADLCPSLLHLDLISGTELGTRFPPPRLILNGLPQPLRRLHIRNHSGLIITVSHLESLPTELESLLLDFPPIFDPNIFTSGAQLALPPLPSTLTHLKLISNHSYYWHVSLSTLPESLVSLHWTSKSHHFYSTFRDGRLHSLLNLTDTPNRLKNLKSFIVPQLSISPQEALSLIPSSVTQLEILARSDSDEYLDRFAKELAPKFRRHYAGYWHPLDELISAGKIPLPMLTDIEHFAFGAGVDFKPEFPSAAPNLKSVKDHKGALPENIEFYQVSNLWLLNPTQPLPIVNSIKLKVLDLSMQTGLPEDWFESLPASLETIEAIFTKVTWFGLMRLMKMDGCMPRLSSLASMRGLDPKSCELGVPKQLQSIYFVFAPGDLPKIFLDELRDSNLEKATFNFKHDESTPNMDRVVGFLNHLPQKLTDLQVTSNCLPSPHWPVKLPPTLNKILFHPEGNQLEVYEGKEGSDLSKPSFVLPDNVTMFQCPNFKLPIPVECLSPYLRVQKIPFSRRKVKTPKQTDRTRER